LIPELYACFYQTLANLHFLVDYVNHEIEQEATVRSVDTKLIMI